MSEKFIEMAKKEIKEDIDGTLMIIKNCMNDTDVSKNAVNIEKHLHKIKGLAPMMNQDKIGEIAAGLDGVLKRIIEHGPIEQSHEIIINSMNICTYILENNEIDIEELKKSISKL